MRFSTFHCNGPNPYISHRGTKKYFPCLRLSTMAQPLTLRLSSRLIYPKKHWSASSRRMITCWWRRWYCLSWNNGATCSLFVGHIVGNGFHEATSVQSSGSAPARVVCCVSNNNRWCGVDSLFFCKIIKISHWSGNKLYSKVEVSPNGRFPLNLVASL